MPRSLPRGTYLKESTGWWPNHYPVAELLYKHQNGNGTRVSLCLSCDSEFSLVTCLARIGCDVHCLKYIYHMSNSLKIRFGLPSLVDRVWTQQNHVTQVNSLILFSIWIRWHLAIWNLSALMESWMHLLNTFISKICNSVQCTRWTTINLK